MPSKTSSAATKTLTIPLVSSAWVERLQKRQQSAYGAIWDLLDQVKDPEVPVLSLWDLGVLTDIRQEPNAQGLCTVVSITPTYSGCPALETMRAEIEQLLEQHGIKPYRVQTCLAPAWTTDWLSPQGRQQLQAYGIAPPSQVAGCAYAQALTPATGIECPQCHSTDTRLISEFGSTACKALFQCQSCHEPFDYFKHL